MIESGTNDESIIDSAESLLRFGQKKITDCKKFTASIICKKKRGNYSTSLGTLIWRKRFLEYDDDEMLPLDTTG